MVVLPNCRYTTVPELLIGIDLMSERLEPNLQGGRSVWHRDYHPKEYACAMFQVVQAVDPVVKNTEVWENYMSITGAT
jgi:hypothetical protein